jgi:hypothetical protein
VISGINLFALKTPKIVGYKTTIFVVALFGDEKWALSLREEHKL